MEQEQARLFRFPFSLPNSVVTRKLSVYTAGALYAIGFWLFLDCVLYSKNANGSEVHVTFVDWIPIICNSLGMLIVSSIDKDRLLEDVLGSGSFAGTSQKAWQAQAVLFFGFALQAGGLSGSFAVLVLKFLVNGYNRYPTLGMGINNVLGNICIVFSCVFLWVAHNIEDEYSYSLTL
ncbi:Vps68p Ecym_2041 [Eremothecium cymbalariae DBVPG|uniref:Vacuolar protein sorting-associated protein 68 n=1 Tax=Eremothecium cymbalariae (strain CBS 270.75 / DBVPG 7215 / KCTC 17166 / NRRL Y-17582) TaxID=931890 RepID=G8JNZ8_ERECY|nr:Hypothetical protein Ecym_2041 [Eremothecium cymbalariae DBVPG\